jgi:hypothetical protein
MSLRRRLPLVAAACVAVAAPSPAHAADTTAARACKSINNPYPGTRYEGTDLRRIRASRVRCSSARAFVRRAHRAALGMTPPPNGIRRFTYRGWRVTGDLRPSTDRYTAKRGRKKITWVF